MPARARAISVTPPDTPPAPPGAVLQVIAPAPYGGAERVVEGVAAGLCGRGRRVMVAALLQDDGPSPFAARLRRAAIEVREIRSGRRRYGAEIETLTRVVRETSAVLLHTHVYHADIVGWRAARRAGIPVVATAHGFTTGDLKNRLYQWLDRRLLRRFDAVVCVSAGVRERLLRAGCPPQRLHLVPNGYGSQPGMAPADARRAVGVTPDAKVIGWIGRVSAEKGPDLLIEAMAAPALHDAQSVVIGDGPETRALAKDAAARAPDRVRLLGARPDAARLLPAFDVLALTSRTEGTPMVLLEAMAAGIPVVAFAVGGIPDVLDARSGWLVPPGDTRALAAGLREALDRPDEARRRADRARDIVERRYGMDRWLDAMEAVYRGVLV